MARFYLMFHDLRSSYTNYDRVCVFAPNFFIIDPDENEKIWRHPLIKKTE